MIEIINENNLQKIDEILYTEWVPAGRFVKIIVLFVCILIASLGIIITAFIPKELTFIGIILGAVSLFIFLMYWNYRGLKITLTSNQLEVTYGIFNHKRIDGIIKEDKLGLDLIYIQAKRWGHTVGRPEIQRFAGALEGKRAKKGIFITTSKFSNEALQYISNINKKIVLIDGQQLAKYMIEHNVGVSVADTYKIKKINLDYFEEE